MEKIKIESRSEYELYLRKEFKKSGITEKMQEILYTLALTSFDKKEKS